MGSYDNIKDILDAAFDADEITNIEYPTRKAKLGDLLRTNVAGGSLLNNAEARELD